MVRVWSKEEQVANQARFCSLVVKGVSVTAACADLGVCRRTGRRWILETNGRAPVPRPEPSGRDMSAEERIQIADLKLAGESVRSIGRRLGRSPSTISRELKRNCPRGRYSPHAAQRQAEQRRAQPKALKLDRPELREIVQSKLCAKWSPEQISLHLADRFAQRPEMTVAIETIYTALYREKPLPKGVARPSADASAVPQAARAHRSASAEDLSHDDDRSTTARGGRPPPARPLGG
jgi:transposase